jgi:hypothetical protein
MLKKPATINIGARHGRPARRGAGGAPRTARDLFPLVEQANDQPTADLLTQRLDVHEKTAWMLRSLLENKNWQAEIPACPGPRDCY